MISTKTRQFKCKSKSFLILLILLILVIFPLENSPVASGNSLQTTVKIGLSGNISTSNYLVYMDGITCFIRNQSTGQIVYENINAATTINHAMALLTNNRTWKEKVVLDGNFIIGSPILIPSYTILQIKGSLYSIMNWNNLSLIKNSNISGMGDTMIELDGGVIDGNSVCGNGSVGIDFSKVTNSLINNVTVQNITYSDRGFGSYGIDLAFCANVTVQNTFVENCNHSGITIDEGSADCVLRNCSGNNCANGNGSKSAIFVIYGSSVNPCFRDGIINCTGSNSKNYIVQIYRYTVDCNVVGGHFSGYVDSGIMVGNAAYVNTCTNTIINGVTVSIDNNTNTNNGIGIYNFGTTIESCTIINATSGIKILDSSCNSCQIIENTILGNFGTSYGFDIVSSQNVISGNTIQNYTKLYAEGFKIRSGASFNLITMNTFLFCNNGIEFEINANNNNYYENFIQYHSLPIFDAGIGNSDVNNTKVSY